MSCNSNSCGTCSRTRIGGHPASSGKPTAERGFAAYRNNVYGNLRHTLRSVYPVVERLVGNDFFGFAASAYIDGQASCSGDLNQYGGEFPAFLLAFPPAQGLPYLADVAALGPAM